MENNDIYFEDVFRIKLLPLLGYLLKKKFWIISGAIIGALIGVAYSLMLPNTYKATVTILPTQTMESKYSGALSGLSGLMGDVGVGQGGGEIIYPSLIKSRRLLTSVFDVKINNESIRQIFIERYKIKKNKEDALLKLFR